MAAQPDNTGIGTQFQGGPGPKNPTNVVTDAPAPQAPPQPSQPPTPLNQMYNEADYTQEQQNRLQQLEQEARAIMNQQRGGTGGGTVVGPTGVIGPAGGSQTMPDQSAVMPDGTVAPLPQNAGQGPYTAPQVQERTVTAPTIDYSEFDPTTRNVTEDQLVSSQLQGLLASDSPYMRQAALAAERQAASRGLLSSSMAAGASQAAAMEAAMPIAAANAQAYQQAASENVSAINNANLAKLQSVTNMATSQLASMTNLATTAMDVESRGQTAALAANAQTLVSQMEIQAQKDMQIFQSEHDKILELQRQNGRVELSQMDYSQRDALMKSGFMHELNMEQFRQQGQMQLAELNINAQKYLQERGFEQQFNMADLTHQQRLELTSIDQGFQEKMMNMQFDHNFDMSELTFDQNQALQNIIHGNTLEQIGFQGSVSAGLFNQQAEAAMTQTIIQGFFNAGGAAAAGGMTAENSIALGTNFMEIMKQMYPNAFASGPDSP